ncbi:hypothetical protein ASE36_11325 [Rhizobium sp. Root274]|uniref:hypothetical protein n=1 Tax=unclassified Rhizobium TaxID=2613769 RepID=UPI0007147B68|nr:MULTISPECIES: hypothetical protein [unclassified Rhizobium]KQW29059.1 hypothetical protein ASC71_11345 [Rhizobium sp. Root1240]KRD29255.1 hypothetical protein ASE36_11325 [Rhizobium sp. Root274]
MPKFLAVFMMRPESLARFRSLSKTEQDAIDAAGVPAWSAWEERHAAAIVQHGGMVGKTLRVTREGIGPATNAICGTLIVEADTAEAAAGLFSDHPHLTIFPGDSVDIMPFVTEPPV